MQAVLIVSNNPLVWDAYAECRPIHGEAREVLKQARDLVHLGHPLVGHPLAGSIRLQNSPFRSVVLGSRPGAYHIRDIFLVEDLSSRLEAVNQQSQTEAALKDYQYIDLSLLNAVIHSGDSSSIV